MHPPVPPYRSSWFPWRYRCAGKIACINHVLFASNETTPTTLPPPQPCVRDEEQPSAQAAHARRQARGADGEEEDQGAADPLRRQRPHSRRTCTSHGLQALLAGKNDAKELWEIFFLPRVMPSCPFPRTRPAARASLARVLYPEPRTLFAAHITLKHEIGPLKP
jgi:hypothetical protein